MILASPAALFGQSDGVEAKAAEAKPERKPRDYQDTSYALTQYEVEKFSELLDLSPEQHETMMGMFAEVRRRIFEAEMPIRAAEDEWIALMRSAFEGEPAERDAKMEEVENRREAVELMEADFGRLKLELVDEFLADFKLLLLPEQLESFDDVMRWRNRHRLLRWGMIPYTDFSVASMARSMELHIDPSRADEAGTPSLEQIYSEYELELDRMLMSRVLAERRFAPGARGMGEGQSGPRAIESEEDRERWREAVGEVNLRLVNMQKKYIRRIANLLTPEDATAFQQRCYDQAYWHVLGDSIMDRVFTGVIEDPRISEEQRARVEGLREEYRAAIAPLDREWIRAFDDLLEEGGARIAGSEVPVSTGSRLIRDGRDDTLMNFYRKKTELQEAWKERIAKLRVEFGLDAPEQPEG
jgi:hypothetical protein